MEDALRKCKNRKQFYDGMVEYGFYLPKYTQQFCAFIVLREILAKKCWCPM